MEEIVYFEINNWFCGRDYPKDDVFKKWIATYQFRDDEWCKKNKLVVLCGNIDMSISYCVAAPKSWVLENCPKLLTDEEYEYKIITCGWDKETNEPKETVDIHTKKYSDFLCHPDEWGDVYSLIDDWQFPEYCEENFGVQWHKDDWEEDDSDEDDDEYYENENEE